MLTDHQQNPSLQVHIRSPSFMEYYGVLPCPPKHATGPYAEPDASSPHPHAQFVSDPL